MQKNRSQHLNLKQKNSSIKNIQIQNGSTKATSSLLVPGFLSQGFIVSNNKNQKIKHQNQKTAKKQNLYDIEKTLDINIEILRNYFKTTTSAMTLLNQDQQIINNLEKIIKINKKKEELLNKIKEKKSKNLIQLQICLEHKRKLEETQNLDNAARAFTTATKNALVSDRREAIIKGSVIPSFSRCIKASILLAGVAHFSLPAAVIGALGALAISAKLTRDERLLLLDEIETELEVVDKELQIADSNNQTNKYRELLKYKKNLQRQYQRIRYNIRVGKDILPGSAGMPEI